VSERPEIILDGAHNPAGARALAAHLERFYRHRRITLVYGAMRDKAVEESSGILFPLAAEVVLTAPAQARAVRPETVREMTSHPRVRVAPRVADALALARDADLVVVAGSLFLVGEARALLVE
jgi:dihydrofolate synthase/folylpolyglutamate synthase